jgi:hypothetical protein
VQAVAVCVCLLLMCSNVELTRVAWLGEAVVTLTY